MIEKGTLKDPLKEHQYSSKQDERFETPARYASLRIMAMLFKVLGVISVIVGVFYAYTLGGGPVSVIILLLGIVFLISFLAISEGIMVLIDIEKNTRITASALLEKSKNADKH